MCDYSLESISSRPAKAGDELVSRNFGFGTRGFSDARDAGAAVCVLPGTELSFSDNVRCISTGFLPWRGKVFNHRTAIFRQISTNKPAVHHDALEFPDGKIVMLTFLREGQQATVLQLPAQPKIIEGTVNPQRSAYAG